MFLGEPGARPRHCCPDVSARDAAMSDRCEHFDTIRAVEPAANGCQDCMALGEGWIGVRVCLTCGHTGCCEDSRHAHALAHFNATGHPMISSLEHAETWGWCYVHRRYFDPMPGPLPRRRSLLGSLWRRLTRH
jgi:hypothetical protein